MQILPPLPTDQRPPIPHFTPVPRKSPRHDGWTPDRQRAFIAALADTGSVTSAARRIGLSPSTAYALRHFTGAEEFAAAWDAALGHGVRQLADIAIDRAIEGVPVPIFWKGQQVGERRWYNDRLLMLILRHHVSADGRGATILSPPRSQAQIEQEAAENCPTCRTRAEQAEEAATQAQAEREAFPPRWLTDLFKRYEAKVKTERRHRLAGEVIAADYTLRQLTHIELVLSMGGRSAEMLDMWSTADGQEPTACHDESLFADPISKLLDELRAKVWARQDGNLERPALPHHHRTLPPGTDQWPCEGDTHEERKSARFVAQARIAQAQAEWEAAWNEETWREWHTGGAKGERPA